MMRALPHRFSVAETETGEKKRAEVEDSGDDQLLPCAGDVIEDASECDDVTQRSSSPVVSGPLVSAASDEKESTTPIIESSSKGSGRGESVGDMDTKEDSKEKDEGSGAAAKGATSPASSTPTPVYSSNTVIMFDWDDTLLASSFLSSRGYRVDSASPSPADADPNDAAQLRALEQTVCSLLKLAMSYGHVNIVTNAETGWVELSAQKFMPAVLPLLSKVTVLSARSTYEPAHPDAPLKWKFYAFHERLRTAFGAGCMDGRVAEGMVADMGEMKKNIASFGDSHVEREAIRAVTRGVAGWRCKSVKFAERPTVEQLRRQLELVSNCFHYIMTHTAELDLQLTVTLHNSPTAPTATA
jgi:hypothetical protein